MNKYFTIFVLLFSLPLITHAEIYKTIDEQGNVSFSDKASKDAKPIKLKPIITYKAQSINKTSSPIKRKLVPDVVYQELTLLSPMDQQTIRSQQGNINIEFKSVPVLQRDQGHSYQILLDDLVFVESLEQTHFMLTGINRGEHGVSIRLIDHEGQVLMQSPEHRFHLKKHSIQH